MWHLFDKKKKGTHTHKKNKTLSQQKKNHHKLDFYPFPKALHQDYL